MTASELFIGLIVFGPLVIVIGLLVCSLSLANSKRVQQLLLTGLLVLWVIYVGLTCVILRQKHIADEELSWISDSCTITAS